MVMSMMNADFWDVAPCGVISSLKLEAKHSSKMSVYIKPTNTHGTASPKPAFFKKRTIQLKNPV
jgi:hypothetical protein